MNRNRIILSGGGTGGVPCLVLRVISDGADEAAAQSFSDFVQVYDQRAWSLIEALLKRLSTR